MVDKGCYRLQNESGKKLKKLYSGVLLKEHFPVNCKAQEKTKLDEVLSSNVCKHVSVEESDCKAAVLYLQLKKKSKNY